MTVLVARAGPYRVERWGKADVDAYQIFLRNSPLDWPAFARGLSERPAVRELLTTALRESELDAYFWECSPWRGERTSVEFVLVPAPGLAPLTACPDAFSQHFDADGVTAFDSLRGDARLVAPCPLGRRDVAVHLAIFVRGGQPAQIDALWTRVGDEIAAWRRQKRGPLWLSTSGVGVPWLHVRLDSRPKYFTHAEYRRDPRLPGG